MKHFKLMKGVLACLLSLALVFSCFTTVGAKATETAGSGETTVTKPTAVTAEYDWSTNSLTADSAAYVYVLKAETGNKVKAGAANGQMAKADGASKFSISMSDLKVKKENKDAYFFICDKEFEAADDSVSANFVIKATDAKKVVATVDFTKADDIDSFNVISAKVTDTKGADKKDPDIVWSTEANGTYYGVNSDNTDSKRKYADGTTDAPDGFDGRTLNEMYGGTVYVKLAGVSGASKTAQFASKAVKVKVSKQAKATAVKIDVKKDTISLKNGFDFGLAKKDDKGEYVAPTEWYTILPVLKTAAVKTEEDSIVATANYTPLGKKDTNAGKKVAKTDGEGYTYSYTQLKVKAMSLTDVLSILKAEDEGDATYIIATRKSASEKKPASAISYIEVAVKAEKPLVYTQDNVKGQYLVATTTDFTKKGFTVGTIVPFPGSESGAKTIATIGYDDTFEVGKVSGSGEIIYADKGGNSFEYAIVNGKDIKSDAGNKGIDWTSVSWKKLDPAKTKITSKFKTKYTLKDGTKVTATLGTESKQIEEENFDDIKSFLIIRRAGVKTGNTRASEYIRLYVAKEGKNYNLYSTVDNGAKASKYIIKFAKYLKNSDGSYAWQAASDVEDISVWAAEGDKKYVTLPAVTSADLIKSTSISGGPTGNAVTTVSGEPNKGKYEVTGASGDTTEYIAIREYVNVTVKQVISGDTSKEIVIYQQKDGKLLYNGGEAQSGQATDKFVGNTLKIENIGEPSISGYVLANGTPANSGEVTFATGTVATAATVEKALNTAEEVVIVIPYTATAQYVVTFDDSAANGKVTYQKKKADGTFDTAVALTSEKKVTLDKGTVIKVIDTADSGKYEKVTFNGSEGTLSEGVATSKEITIDKALTITVVGKLAAAESSESQGN